MQIILLTFIFLVAVIFTILSMFRKVLSFLFGGFAGKTGNQSQQNGSYQSQSSGHEDSAKNEQENSKVFSKDEGEYVKYEEID